MIKLDNQNKLEFVAVALPLLLTFLAVFITRSSVGVYFLMIAGLLVIEFALLKTLHKQFKFNFKQLFPFMLIVGASIGLAASGVLTLEKIEILKNPNYVTSCSVSPVVACSPVINSGQASAFTLPNPSFGLFGFGCLLAAGMALLAVGPKVKFKDWWWLGMLGASATGLGFVGWLIYESLYSISSLCLYCISTWMAVIPIFFLTLKYSLDEGVIKLKQPLQKVLQKYPLELTVSSYMLVAGLILQRFWSYWISLL